MNAEKALFSAKEEIQVVSSQSESGKQHKALRAKELQLELSLG